MNELKVLITREQIAERVAAIGADISSELAGESVLLLAVLKGAAIFLADLARAIQLETSFDFIGVSSYAPRPSPEHELKHGWDPRERSASQSTLTSRLPDKT